MMLLWGLRKAEQCGLLPKDFSVMSERARFAGKGGAGHDEDALRPCKASRTLPFGGITQAVTSLSASFDFEKSRKGSL